MSDSYDEAVAHLPPMAELAEARAVLRCSPSTVYRRVRDGEIEAVLVAGRLLFPRAALASYLRSKAVR